MGSVDLTRLALGSRPWKHQERPPSSTSSFVRQAKPMVLSLDNPAESTREVLEFEIERIGDEEELAKLYDKLKHAK